MWKHKGPQIATVILRKENRLKASHTLTSDNIAKQRSPKQCRTGQESRCTDQRNRTLPSPSSLCPRMKGQYAPRRAAARRNNDFNRKASPPRRWPISTSENHLPSVPAGAPSIQKGEGWGPRRRPMAAARACPAPTTTA